MSLREAANRLAGYGQFRRTGSRGTRELLKLLQSQKIRAAFDFPSEARSRIDIPARFWLDTSSGDFQNQLYSRHRRHGQFLIDPAKFIDQYAAWFSDNYLGERISPERRTTAAAEVTSALVGIKTKKEVYILESEWARFVKDNGLDEAEHWNEVARSTRGRRPREGWEIVLVEVAAEMLARQAQGQIIEDKQSRIAEGALSRAKLPSGAALELKRDTVAKKISEILTKTDKLGPLE